ncbi:MAG: hypothetical protein RIB67_07300 [Miltoncostaeaceae bacterium]
MSMTITTPAPAEPGAALAPLLDAIQERSWELLLGPAASGGWLASAAGGGLHHPLRASGPTPEIALDELALLVAEQLHEQRAEPPAPSDTFIVRAIGSDGHMVSIPCADLTEAREVAGQRDGHIVRHRSEVVR